MSVELEQALVQRYVDGAFGLPTAYENKGFTPTAGVPCAELKTFINDETPFSLNDSNQNDGFLQIILRYPEDEYSWKAKIKRDQIKAVFKIGTRIVTPTGKLQITRVLAPSEGENDNGWYKIVIRFFFTAVLPR